MCAAVTNKVNRIPETAAGKQRKKNRLVEKRKKKVGGALSIVTVS